MKTRRDLREKRKRRIRRNLKGEGSRPRMSIFKSSRHIYAQVIDDVQGKTLASASTMSSEIRNDVSGVKKTEAAGMVGELIGRNCKEKNIIKVVLDRNGFPYHGRIKSLAESARKAGLKF